MTITKLTVFGTLALACAGSAAAQTYSFPDNIQDCNILHCFDWKFDDIVTELPNIAAAGFGAIQVSPVQGNCSTNAEWYYAYMPYDFVFRTNGNGTKAKLQNLCEKASEYGIKIIVDVVANHINKATNYHDTWWDENGRIRWEGSVNYSSRSSITHGQLGEYGDVNSEDAEVQARAVAFIEALKELGVKGIRWDAAKHIGLPSESCDFWPQVCSVAGMWNYGEILDTPGGSDKYGLLAEYCKYMSVTDTQYSSSCRSNVNRGYVPASKGSWTNNSIPANCIVYWAESHDNYSDGTSVNITQAKIDLAWAIGACRNKETSLYFSRPFATTRTTIKMGVKGSTHCLEAPEIAAVNNFRNAMTGRADAYVAINSPSGIACITREGGGAVIVVGNGSTMDVEVENANSYCPVGTYVDQVSGNTFTVTSTTIKGTVGSTGIAVINALGSGIENVEVDNSFTGEPEYYTLQGVRVTEPVSGNIYVVRRGNTVTKELIR